MHISQYHLSLKQPLSNNISPESFFPSSVTRPRAYSKPTHEELKELNTYLAQRSADELRSVIELAATQSTEAARVLLKLLHDIQSMFQPVQSPTEAQLQSQLQSRHQECGNDGLLTPADSGEDSEMSGTDENVLRQLQPQKSSSLFSFPESLPFPQIQSQSQSQIKATSPAQERRLKRKSLAVEWDDTIYAPRITGSSDRAGATTTTSLQHLPSIKRRRAPYSLLKENHPLSSCVNCGMQYAPSKPDGLHGCMYHPGILTAVETEHLEGARKVIKTGMWDCCRGSHSSPGCLVTQHREVNLAGYKAWSLSSCIAEEAGHNTGVGMGLAVGARSAFAEAVSARLLVR